MKRRRLSDNDDFQKIAPYLEAVAEKSIDAAAKSNDEAAVLILARTFSGKFSIYARVYHWAAEGRPDALKALGAPSDGCSESFADLLDWAVRAGTPDTVDIIAGFLRGKRVYNAPFVYRCVTTRLFQTLGYPLRDRATLGRFWAGSSCLENGDRFRVAGILDAMFAKGFLTALHVELSVSRSRWTPSSDDVKHVLFDRLHYFRPGHFTTVASVLRNLYGVKSRPPSRWKKSTVKGWPKGSAHLDVVTLQGLACFGFCMDMTQARQLRLSRRTKRWVFHHTNVLCLASPWPKTTRTYRWGQGSALVALAIFRAFCIFFPISTLSSRRFFKRFMSQTFDSI